MTKMLFAVIVLILCARGEAFAENVDLPALIKKLEASDPAAEKQIVDMGERIRVWDANHAYSYQRNPSLSPEPSEERALLNDLSMILLARARNGNLRAMKIIYRTELFYALDLLVRDLSSSGELSKIITAEILGESKQGVGSLQHLRQAVVDYYFNPTIEGISKPEEEMKILRDISDRLHVHIREGDKRVIRTMIEMGFISDLAFLLSKGERFILPAIYDWILDHPSSHYGRIEVLHQLRSPFLAQMWTSLGPDQSRNWCDLLLSLTLGKDESVGNLAISVLSNFVHIDDRVLPRLREVFNRGLEVSRDDYKELTISQMFAAEAIAQAALPIQRTVLMRGLDVGAGKNIHSIQVEEGLRVAGLLPPDPLNYSQGRGNTSFEWYVHPTGESAHFQFEWPWKWSFSNIIFVSYGNEDCRGFTTVLREYYSPNLGPNRNERVTALFVPTSVYGWRDGIIFNLLTLFDENRGQTAGESLVSIWAAKILALLGDSHGLQLLNEIPPRSSRTKFNNAFLKALHQFVGSEPYQSILGSKEVQIIEIGDAYSSGIDACRRTLQRLDPNRQKHAGY